MQYRNIQQLLVLPLLKLTDLPVCQAVPQVAIQREEHHQEHGELPDQQGATHQGYARVQTLRGSLVEQHVRGDPGCAPDGARPAQAQAETA